MTRIYYLLPENEFSHFDFHPYLHLLPAFEQKKILSFREKIDSCLSMCGKLMLMHSFRDFGIDLTDLGNMQLSEFKKPLLPLSPPLHFSISHCKEVIAVAVSNDYPVGIDVESLHPVEINLFSNVFSDEIFGCINRSDNPLVAFYLSWTRYEASLKAHGKGFLTDLKEVSLKGSEVFVENKTWYTSIVHLHDKCVCSLATPAPEAPIEMPVATRTDVFSALLPK